MKTLSTCALLFFCLSAIGQGWLATDSVTLIAQNRYLAPTPLNVGIGTRAPSAQFHTTGTVRFAGLTQNNAANNIVVADANGNLYVRKFVRINGIDDAEVESLENRIKKLENQLIKLQQTVEELRRNSSAGGNVTAANR